MSDNIVIVKIGDKEKKLFLEEKEFKTGSRGFHATGKMEANDKKYQLNIQCVEIGSKPKSP